MGALQQHPAHLLGSGDAAGPHQTAGLFGEQAVAAGIRRIHQPDRPPQEVRGDVG
jgi:hypothetical protein